MNFPCAALLLLAVPALASAQTYRIVDLGDVGGQSAAFTIDPSGRAAGNVTDLSAHFLPAVFDQTPMVLPHLSGFAEHVVFAFGPAGDPIGTAYTLGSLTPASFVSAGGIAASLGQFQARAVNASGVVAGTTIVDNAGLKLPTACTAQGGVISTLPSLGGITSQALGIDDLGRVVGSSTTSGEASIRPTLWIGGIARDLGTLGGANGQAYAIAGTRVIGWSQNTAGVKRPTRWTLDAAGNVITRTDLGGASTTAPGCARAFGPGADVLGVSSFRAMLFRADAAIDLNTRVLSLGGWTLEQAWSANASGQIAGSGSLLGFPRAFRLDPCLADVNSDLVIDLDDFFWFLNCFDQSQSCADIDGEPGVDLGDFFTFFNGFDAGC
jgi:hypothetical protein